MAGQTYTVTRKNHTDRFQKQLSDFIDHQILCDVTLVSEGQVFKAHQFILATSSSYFRNIFQEVPVSQHPIIFLRDVTPQEIKCVLDYIYKGETVVPKDVVPSFLKTCESLRVLELCEDQNRRSMSISDDGQTTETLISNDQVDDNISSSPARQLVSQNNDLNIQSRKRQSKNTDREFVQLKQSKSACNCQNKLTSSTPDKNERHSRRNLQSLTPSFNDMTQIDLPSEETYVNNNVFNEDILDSPPRSPQSLIFSVVNPEKQITSTDESVIIISQNSSEVLEISDDDSRKNVSKNQASKSDKILAVGHSGREPIPDDSEGTVDDIQLVLSADDVPAGDQSETDESEIVNTRNVNRFQTKSLRFDNLNQLNPESPVLQQMNLPDNKQKPNQLNQQLKVVLTPLPCTFSLQNSTHKDVHQDEDSSGGEESIESVPANLKKKYCKTCSRCVHPLFWKRHVRDHLKKGERAINIRTKKAF